MYNILVCVYIYIYIDMLKALLTERTAERSREASLDQGGNNPITITQPTI